MKGMFTAKEQLLLIGIGAVGLIFLLLGADKLAVRLACGAWPHRQGDGSAFTMLLKLVTGDIGAWVGTTESGCTAPNWVLWAVPVVGIAILIAAIAWAIYRWNVYKLSPAYLRSSLLERKEVVARGREVKREMGRDVAISRGRKVRPEHSEEVGRKFAPEDAAYELGSSQGVQTWISMEDAVLLIGPPRSGKGFGVLTSQIIGCPGPVVTTSTRGDNMQATILARSKVGPVYVFDPAGVTGRESTLKWSPIAGCEDGERAKKRAELLIEGTGLGAGDSGNNQEFATKAVEILQALLHAAAIGGKGLDALYTWTKDPERAREAVELLRERSPMGWHVGLNATIQLPSEPRQAQWFGVASALSPVDVPGVRGMFSPGPEDPVFDPETFLRENGTLYLISPVKPAGKATGVGVMLALLLDAITETAHEMAMMSPSGRLDPPLALVLDEIANVFAWPAMPNWMAAGSGEGIQVTGVIQSRSQLRAGWGAESAVVAWEAATRKIILGGGSNKADLEEAVALLGERTHRTVQGSWGGDRETSFNENESFRSGISVDELRRLPELMALLIAGRARAIAVDLVPFTKRPFVEDITASQAWHKEHPPVKRDGELGPVFPVHGLAAEQEKKAKEGAADFVAGPDGHIVSEKVSSSGS